GCTVAIQIQVRDLVRHVDVVVLVRPFERVPARFVGPDATGLEGYGATIVGMGLLALGTVAEGIFHVAPIRLDRGDQGGAFGREALERDLANDPMARVTPGPRIQRSEQQTDEP